MSATKKQLSQYFTPVWAAEILFNSEFSHLTSKDLVWEPSCGTGSFLSAIPKHISAIGTDIDAELVAIAASNTGRSIYHGDFRTVQFDCMNEVTAIVGNPPFRLDLFEEFMERCENILPLGNKAAFILPAYFFQTSKTVMRLCRKWDINSKPIPRDLFECGQLLSKPILWASFIRDNFPKLIAMGLYRELTDIKSLSQEAQELLTNQVKRSGSIWREVVIGVIRDSGGTATLDQVYQRIEGKRPTPNPFWKEKIRQIIQQSPFIRSGPATYTLQLN